MKSQYNQQFFTDVTDKFEDTETSALAIEPNTSTTNRIQVM